VHGVEEFSEAVADAEYNCSLNQIKNAKFHCGRVEDLLPSLVRQHSFSTIVLDPPRKGVDSTSLKAIAEQNIPRILYVSCSPMTLERDVKYLVQQGYKVQSITPFDMFPQTWHIETVVQLKRT